MTEQKTTDKSTLNSDKIKDFIYKSFDNSVLPTLQEYIKIPNQSPDYDKDIYTNGYQEKALKLLENWVKNNKPKNCKINVLQEKEMTPFIFIEIDKFNSESKDTILMYGHFDKQPPLTKDWDKDLGPYKPVIKNGRLYGRGGADDGYSIFAAIDSVRALQDQNASHPRIVITIEGGEESGSPHLDYYLDKLKDKIGVPKLDAGGYDFDKIWLGSSLRGIVTGTLKCQLLKEGIHSGSSGLVRDSFHVIRHVLDKFDDPLTGKCKIPELNSKIPQHHVKYAENMGKQMGNALLNHSKLLDGVKSQTKDIKELMLNYVWKPQLSITGIDGIPDLKGGNVLRKYTTLKLSIRIPPDINPTIAVKAIKNTFESNPPFDCKLEFNCDTKLCGQGFCCPEFKEWLLNAINESCKVYFNGNKCFISGHGGSIPIMGQLQKNYPKSQFIVTGALGPDSSIHGPNECLNIEFTKKFICCLAYIINACGVRKNN